MYAYVWFGLMRPDYIAWVQGAHPYSLILAVCTLIGTLPYLPTALDWFRNPFCILLALLTALFWFSVNFAIDPSLCWEPLKLFMTVFVMCALIPVLIRTEQHVKDLFLVIAFSMGGLGFKMGLSGLISGGSRYSQGPGGFLGDNNCAALAFAMVIPMCWYGRQLVKATWAKMLLLAIVFGNMAAIVFTYSRGGAISMVVALLMIAFRSKHKLIALVLMVVLMLPAVLLVGVSYQQRLATLNDPGAAGNNRLTNWKAGLKMWMDHPLFGVGFGAVNYRVLIGRYLAIDDPHASDDTHVAHNTYLQVLADSGIAPLLVYLGLMFYAIIWLGRNAKKWRRLRPGMEVVPWGIQAALIAFMVGSTFLSRVTFDLYYMLVMLTASWHFVTASQKSVEPVAVPTPARMVFPKRRAVSAMIAGSKVIHGNG
jgi:probable O-glycosylation ligase (exosortase A-associated)